MTLDPCSVCLLSSTEFVEPPLKKIPGYATVSCHLLPAPFLLKMENTTKKHLISSEPHSHKPFAPNTSVSVADRLALKQHFMATLFISTINVV
jgi:hypothetical protein